MLFQGRPPWSGQQRGFFRNPEMRAFLLQTHPDHPPAARRPPAAGRSQFPPRGTVNPGPPGEVLAELFPDEMRYEMISFSLEEEIFRLRPTD